MYKWWDDHNGTDLQKPAAKYLVVKDVSEEGKGIVVGYAKWWVPVGDERLQVEDRFPAWPEEGSEELLNTFFGNMAKERKEFMGDKQYYCKSYIQQDVLSLSPVHREGVFRIPYHVSIFIDFHFLP